MSRTIRVKDILGKSITSDGKAVMPIDVTGKTLGELSSDDLVAAIYQPKGPAQVTSSGPSYPGEESAPATPNRPIREVFIEEDEEE